MSRTDFWKSGLAFGGANGLPGMRFYDSADAADGLAPALLRGQALTRGILTDELRRAVRLKKNQLPRMGSISPGFMLRSRHQRSITSALKRQSVPMRKPGNSPRRRSL